MSKIFIPLKEQDYEFWISLREFIENTDDIIPEDAISTTKGEHNAFYGKKHTAETRKKMRDYALAQTHSEETKKKIGSYHKGKIVSEETRKRMSAGIKAAWARRKGETF